MSHGEKVCPVPHLRSGVPTHGVSWAQRIRYYFAMVEVPSPHESIDMPSCGTMKAIVTSMERTKLPESRRDQERLAHPTVCRFKPRVQ